MKAFGNFRAFGFKSNEMRDYTKTVINSLTEVRRNKQIPPAGPGVIYIDINPPLMFSAVNSLKIKFDEISVALFPHLQSVNRRVNAVVLTCTAPIKIRESNESAIVMQCRVIRHSDPKTKLPSKFLLPNNMSN